MPMARPVIKSGAGESLFAPTVLIMKRAQFTFFQPCYKTFPKAAAQGTDG